MVLRNFLDENVFFLHVTIVLTCFKSKKSQNKLDLMQSFLLDRFTKLVKMNFKREQSKKSHASVILNSHFSWIFTKALFYILKRLSASKLLRKALKLPRKLQLWTNFQFRFKTGSWCIAEYYLPKCDDYILKNKTVSLWNFWLIGSNDTKHWNWNP